MTVAKSKVDADAEIKLVLNRIHVIGDDLEWPLVVISATVKLPRASMLKRTACVTVKNT